MPILANSVYFTASWEVRVTSDAGLTINSISSTSRWTVQSARQGSTVLTANAILAQEVCCVCIYIYA